LRIAAGFSPRRHPRSNAAPREAGEGVVHVIEPTGTEQWLENRVCEDTRIEGVLESVQALFTASMFVEGGQRAPLSFPSLA
jgi:hypothetical protein